MPIYEYCCEECDHVFEVLQSGFDERRETCPLCKGESKRVISNTSFVLKGSGWYVTDYAGKNPSNGGSSDNGNGAGKNGDAKSADAKSSDAKSDGGAKPEAPAPASKPACGGCAKSCSAES